MRRNFTRIAISVGVSLLGLISVPVAAQSNASSAATDESPGIADIVVTAQRRSESAQRIPIAVTSLSAVDLAKSGTQDTYALATSVPGLNVTSTSSIAVIFLRGVGTSNLTLGDENAVSVYIDGVYQASPVGSILSLNNVKNIEVIKGPQGTLFGRNATGGVIQITTRSPKYDPSADLSLSYANYNTVTANAYVTTGLTRSVATDLAVYFNKQYDGWGKNLFDGRDVYKGRDLAIRNKWLIEPGPNTKIVLSADYSRINSDINTALRVVPPATLVGQPAFPGFYNVNINDRSFSRTTAWGGAATATHNFEFATLKSITSYRRNRTFIRLDQDSTASTSASTATNLTLNFDAFVRTFTQEIQLLSPEGDRFNWVAGAYFYRSSAGYDRGGFALANNGNDLSTTLSTLKTTSYAIFGQANFEVVKGVKLTVGLRQTHDRRELDALQILLPSRTPRANYPTHGEKSFNKLTYRAAIDYQMTPTALAYASYTRGFKSGLFNAAAPLAAGSTTPVAVNPEVLDAYEIGLKTDLFDRRVRFNLAAFYYDYANLQVGQVVAGATLVRNAASARIKGIDVDLVVAPVRHLQFTASFEVLDAKFRRFPGAPIYTLNPAGGDFSPVAGDASGNRLLFSPKFSGRLSADYTIPSPSGDITLSGNYYYNGGFFRSVDNRLAEKRYSLVGASISWKSPDERFSFSLWGKNLTNTHYLNYAVQTAPYGDHGAPAAPRTYGLTGTVHFGN